MKLFIEKAGGEKARLPNMNGTQTRQAASVMEQFAGYIPIEGKDYDIEITFSETNSSRVGIKIVAYTERGEFWRDYVATMMKKDKEGR